MYVPKTRDFEANSQESRKPAFKHRGYPPVHFNQKLSTSPEPHHAIHETPDPNGNQISRDVNMEEPPMPAGMFRHVEGV